LNILFAGPSNAEVNASFGIWAAKRIFENGGHFAPPFSTMGVFDGSELIAVIVFHNYSAEHGVIEISGAADTPRWLAKPVLWAMFSFPFLKLGCQMVTMRVDPEDRRLKRILTAYGFTNIRIPRLRGRDKDEILYMLTDDAWRSNGFHKELSDGQKERS
jgi:RimJ/RimL family protein N-acetyltransferase